MIENSHRQPPSVSASMDELAEHCFGCGSRNPQGLQLRFTLDPVNLTSSALVELTETHQGPPGFLHGGIIATLLDEAGSKLNRLFGVLAMTRHMEIDYLRPAPVRTSLRLFGRHVRREGRKLFHEASLNTADGALLARAQLLFVAIPTDLLPESVRGELQAREQDLA